jgi:ATP-independent RNA helicase DbpA
MKFISLQLPAEFINNLDSLGYKTMTPIQERSLPFILQGKDVIGQAKTGSGKTAAFGLGLLSNLDVSLTETQALVLCPTRELSEQVTTELRRLARFTPNIKVLSLCGGTDEKHQKKSLEYGVHIIVGTPGRIYKLLLSKAIELDNLKTFVLDEADRMLDMGFAEDINRIERFTPEVKQTLLFSATFPSSIESLSSHIQNNPEFIKVDTTHDENSIQQIFYELKSHKEKSEVVNRVLANYKPRSTVIFCKTKLICDALTKELHKFGIDALALHGDHDQRDRTLVLSKFSNGSVRVLVATDVAARGLDIDDLELVINYDLSSDPEVHIHRIGRTGRVGKEGLAVNLFIEQEQFKIDAIKDYIDTNIEFSDIADLDTNKVYDLQPEMKTLFISGGRKDKLRPGDIVGAILGTSGVEASSIGDIKVLNVFSYVAVKSEVASKVLQGLQNGKIKKRKFRIGYA